MGSEIGFGFSFAVGLSDFENMEQFSTLGLQVALYLLNHSHYL